MISEATYGYADGALLDAPHSYQYTPFLGHPFLESWAALLADVQAELGEPLPPPAPCSRKTSAGTSVIRTEELLEELFAELARSEESPEDEIRETLKRLVKKFETSKRLFACYDEAFVPVDKREYRDLNLYLRMAETTERAYVLTQDLVYLNVFLKLVDLLTAYKGVLQGSQKNRVSWLIRRILEHVRNCARKNEVEICI
jgi:hypothetical protein